MWCVRVCDPHGAGRGRPSTNPLVLLECLAHFIDLHEQEKRMYGGGDGEQEGNKQNVLPVW